MTEMSNGEWKNLPVTGLVSVLAQVMMMMVVTDPHYRVQRPSR